MTTGYVIHAEDGRAWHTEVLRGVAACGRTFDLDAEHVSREPFEPGGRDAEHSTMCFDCSGSARRRTIEQLGGRST